MKRIPLQILVWWLLAALAAMFAADTWLRSDARLTDRGRLAAERYAFDFGAVPTGSEHRFAFRSPANERFCFGLRTNGSNNRSLATTEVRIVLWQGDEVLIQLSNRLSEWTVSTTSGDVSQFIYPRHLDRMPSCVDLKRYHRYVLEFSLRGSGTGDSHPRLIARGGGWK
jgi:hypothetical protein